ncbi:unnamed protein product [Rhizophagus irregularis]|nr:unnamed protein product [Rhizophagus irregularis]
MIRSLLHEQYKKSICDHFAKLMIFQITNQKMLEKQVKYMMHFIGANGDCHYLDYAFCEPEKDREVPKIPNVPIGINIQIQSIKTTISDKDE